MNSCYQKNISIIKKNYLAFLLFSLGMLICLRIIKFGENSFGDLSDGSFNKFVLEHFYLALIGKQESFVNGNFFYPLPMVMQLSDNHWFLGVFYAIPRLLGVDSITSFNIWSLLGFILNFWICYLVLLKFKFSKKTSALGAYLFAFNQIFILKVGHIQLNFKIFVPLAILYAKRYFDTQNIKYISYIILCITLQLMCSSYNGSFLFLYIVVIFLFYLAQFKINEFSKFLPKFRDIKTTIAILVISLGLLAIYGIPYFEVKNIYESHTPKNMGYGFEFRFLFTIYSDIWNYITEYFKLKSLQFYAETQYFVGLGVWLAIIYFIVKSIYFRSFRKGLSASHFQLQSFDKIIIKSTIFIIIFFWLDKYTYNFYFLQIILPNFTNLRAFSRFFLVIFFGFVYLVCLTLDNIELQKKSNKTLYWVMFLLMVIEPVFQNSISENFREKETKEVEEYKKLITKFGNKDSIPFFVYNQFSVINELNAMMATRDLGLKTINGYSSNFNFVVANNCQEIDKIIIKLEESADKILRRKNSINNLPNPEAKFKYNRKNLLIFLNKKLCKIY